MIATDLIRDGLVRLVDGRLQVRPNADDGALTFIRAHRDELVHLLAANDATRGPTREDLLRALGPSFPIEAGPDDRVMVRTAAVLEHADGASLADLLDIDALIAFATSLVADGLVEAWTERVMPDLPPRMPVPVRVRCCDCRHFEPDTVGFGQGIGSCAIDAPEQRRQPPTDHFPAGHYGNEPALWPKAERVCPAFEQAAAVESTS